MASTRSQPFWKNALAWLSFALSGVVLIMSPTMGSFRDFLAGAIIGTAILLPGIWWTICNFRDAKARNTYMDSLRTHEELTLLLGPTDPSVVRGMGILRPPKPVKRHWMYLSIVSVLLVFVAGMVAPPVEEVGETQPNISESP
ncbi:hypothetical protein CFAEC_03525 [Corynebacterium faecale]|uniref:hypothetical protein n=1 Tax=Corynebacterium faecale TaxID=1758466 RepID=UPI0025B33AEA|nr:hypothetical protein [Corynebacterium faecale]WJY91557.1 hypothetical protein CFAEC_03525 [Corynebacterium faecale]